MNSNSTYQRQWLLPYMSEQVQHSLQHLHVLVVGVGGLGCPLLMQLGAFGIGNVGIVDGDVVSESNLHRQLLFKPTDVGKLKVKAATDTLQSFFPNLRIQAYPAYLESKHAYEIFKSYDIIIDATDNIGTRYLINDTALLAKKAWIYGALYQYEGQVAVFNVPTERGYSKNYRDLFPFMPSIESILTCDYAGAIVTHTTLIASMMAQQVVWLVAAPQYVFKDRLWCFDLKTGMSFVVQIKGSYLGSGMPSNQDAFKDAVYELPYGTTPSQNMLLSYEGLFDCIQNSSQSDVAFIDVREADEVPKIDAPCIMELPWSLLQKQHDALYELTQSTWIFFCSSGIRSREAALKFKSIFQHHTILYTDIPPHEVYHVVEQYVQN